MPGAALESSIEDCLRRPSPGAAAWSLGAARMFVGGVLSLVSRSSRSLSLCQAVVSVLVRFVAEKGCGLAGKSSIRYNVIDTWYCVAFGVPSPHHSKCFHGAREVVGESFVW